MILHPTRLLPSLGLLIVRLIVGRNRFDKLTLFLGSLSGFAKFVHGGIHIYGLTLYIVSSNLKFFSPDDTGGYNEIYVNDVYCRFFKPKKGSTVIDIGSHIGFFTIKASTFVGKEGLVVSLEPHPINYHLLLHNIKRNKIANVIPLKVAASSYSGTAKMNISSKSYAHTICPKHYFTKSRITGGHVDRRDFTGNSLEVQCVRVDEVVQDLNIQEVDFLKIDVEGYEMEVLRGAKKSLNRIKHVVVSAYHILNKAKEVQVFLEEERFNTRIMDGHIYAER